MAFFVRDCVRCGVRNVQHIVRGEKWLQTSSYEVFASCQACGRGSIYSWTNALSIEGPSKQGDGTIDVPGLWELSDRPVVTAGIPISISTHVPSRIADLMREASLCRSIGCFEAAGAMFRKTVDVATKHIFASDPRLQAKTPASNLRPRIKALAEMGILEADIAELADVAALDGNDATHDVDPYTAVEAEALEELTFDLLDRLFVRPARLAEVKAKQLASGQRRAD